MAYKSTINTGLPNSPEPPDPAFFPEFVRLYNAIRNLTIAIDKYTGSLPVDVANFSATSFTDTILVQNLHRVYVQFSEAASYGQMVNLANVSGRVQARLANATVAGKHIHAWCSTAGGVLINGWGEVMIGGLCTAVGSLTPGATYYAGNTAGTVAPSAGTISQKIGYALDANSLIFKPDLI